jgi:hypothetical protein
MSAFQPKLDDVQVPKPAFRLPITETPTSNG